MSLRPGKRKLPSPLHSSCAKKLKENGVDHVDEDRGECGENERIVADAELSQNIFDPDYQHINNTQNIHTRIAEIEAKDVVVNKIKSIINKQFDQEIAWKKEEISKIEMKLDESFCLMDKLRACIIANYYLQPGFTSGRENVGQHTQPSIHPAITSALGKAPRNGALVKTESTPSRPASPLPKEIIKKEDVADVQRSARFKIKKTVVVGNVSKFIAPENREENDHATHKWMIYVRGPRESPGIDDWVEKVWFFLHPSYRPNDLVEVTTPPFHLVRRGWGEFPVRVQLFLKNNCQRTDIIHSLKLDKTYTGLQTLGAETVVHVHLDSNFPLEEKLSNSVDECISNPAKSNSLPLLQAVKSPVKSSGHQVVTNKSIKSMKSSARILPTMVTSPISIDTNLSCSSATSSPLSRLSQLRSPNSPLSSSSQNSPNMSQVQYVPQSNHVLSSSLSSTSKATTVSCEAEKKNVTQPSAPSLLEKCKMENDFEIESPKISLLSKKPCLGIGHSTVSLSASPALSLTSQASIPSINSPVTAVPTLLPHSSQHLPVNRQLETLSTSNAMVPSSIFPISINSSKPASISIFPAISSSSVLSSTTSNAQYSFASNASAGPAVSSLSLLNRANHVSQSSEGTSKTQPVYIQGQDQHGRTIVLKTNLVMPVNVVQNIKSNQQKSASLSTLKTSVNLNVSASATTNLIAKSSGKAVASNVSSFHAKPSASNSLQCNSLLTARTSTSASMQATPMMKIPTPSSTPGMVSLLRPIAAEPTSREFKVIGGVKGRSSDSKQGKKNRDQKLADQKCLESRETVEVGKFIENIRTQHQLRLPDFDSWDSLLRTVVHWFPFFLEEKSIQRQKRPCCPTNMTEYLKWNIGKRRSSEWFCASSIHRELINQNGSEIFRNGIRVPSVRYILDSCRSHGFFPLPPELCLPTKSLTSRGIYSSITKAPELLDDSWTAATAMEDDELSIDVDEVSDEEPEAPAKSRVPKDHHSSPKILLAPAAQFVQQQAAELGVTLSSQLHCSEMILAALLRFVENLIRQSHTEAVRRKRKPDEILPQHIYQALQSVPHFDFLTNSGLGIPVASQPNQR